MPEIRMYEELAANAHVALNVVQYDGWLLRFSGGHTSRANSVSVLYPSTIDPEEKIGYCEECYRAQGLPCVFKITDADMELNSLLERRGYRVVTPTDVMVSGLQQAEKPEGTVVYLDRPTEEWLSAYFTYEGLNDPGRQEIFRRMLEKVQARTCYAAVTAGGRIVACASSATERGYTLLQNVVTDPEARGRGYGKTICKALLNNAKENGAKQAYLQVVQSNRIAVHMYENLGFRTVYTYRYMKKETR